MIRTSHISSKVCVGETTSLAGSQKHELVRCCVLTLHRDFFPPANGSGLVCQCLLIRPWELENWDIYQVHMIVLLRSGFAKLSSLALGLAFLTSIDGESLAPNLEFEPLARPHNEHRLCMACPVEWGLHSTLYVICASFQILDLNPTSISWYIEYMHLACFHFTFARKTSLLLAKKRQHICAFEYLKVALFDSVRLHRFHLRYFI